MPAAGDSASNQRDSGRSSGGGRRRSACRRVAAAHRMRVASSSPAGRDHRRERTRASGALQQERAIVVRQDARRTVAVPPGHQPAAAALLFLPGDLEHGGLAAMPYRQQETGRRGDHLAVRDEIPAGEPGPVVNLWRQSPPLPPSTTTVSFSGSSSRTTSRVGCSGHTKSASSGCMRPWKRSTWERPQ